MIRPIQITLNAAHPELPLVEASTFVGSPSTAFVRGVPATVGSWSITAVRLVFAYPDNSIVTANCVNAASGVWVGTIAPTATSGRTANGYQVLADGIDENGDAVTGYVLGMGDLAVYTRDMTIDGAAGVKWYLHYFDTAPATPKKGDVAKVNGLICLYDGTAWVSFGDGPGFSTDAPAMDGTASAGVAETAARSDHVHPTDTSRASTADATLTPVYSDNPTFSEWTITPATYNGYPLSVIEDGMVYKLFANGSVVFTTEDYENATSVTWTSDGNPIATATRVRTDILGYQLGSQDDKPLASEAEAEALRTAITAIAPDWTSGVSYAQYDIVKYNGVYYYAKQATSGTTAPSSDTTNWGSLANLAALAHLFLPLTGGMMDGTLILSSSFDSASSGSLEFRSQNGNRAWGIGAKNDGALEFCRKGTWDYITLRSIDGGIIAFLSDIGIPAFDSTATYALNAKVVYDNAVWNCTTAVSTAGAWTGTTNWTKLFDLAADSAPTANSASLMTSGAIKTALDGKADKPTTFTAGNLAALDANGNPTDSGVKASDKLDASSASAPFSEDNTVQYPVGSHVTYNGKLYKCTTATTGGTWDASKWTADTMTDPDAVLDITSQNQLRVVAKDGTLLWAQGYDLASTSSATLACDACNNFTFADGATTQAFTLPTAPTGKVGDFGLDIDNSANTGAATMTLTGLDTTFSVVVPEGESLNDVLAIAAGELARFYITLSTFRVNNLPTWHIMKQVVENGGAQS